jgi:hypothetical protein
VSGYLLRCLFAGAESNASISLGSTFKVSARTQMWPGGGTKLWASTARGEPLGEITFVTGARETQKSRPVRQQLWAREVEIADGRQG